jgi:hypothetical protein
MKKFYIILIALLMVSGASAQQPCSTCLPEGITFTTQSQIDSFQVNYPGCTEIEGNVSIGNIGGSDITNLNALIVLTSIGGDIWISENNVLTSLTGLENLTSVAGGISIYYNVTLTSLTGLDNLTSIGGGLYICRNQSLSSLTSLNNLTSIGGSLGIDDNVILTNLAGLEGLTYIGGNLSIGSSYYGGNPSLTSLTGLDNLTLIGGLLINYNHALTSLTGLGNLTFIAGDIIIHNNHALTSLTGLGNVTTISGGIEICNNQSMISLTELDDLTIIGGILKINDNVSLSACNAQWLCDYLAEPNGAVVIYGNATGCNSVIDVAFACGGEPCLQYGTYNFYSQSDIDLFQAAFPNCSELQVGIQINGDDITDLSGLNSVTSTAGDLKVFSNNALTSLSGLEGLTSIGGGLVIGNFYLHNGNPVLTSLSGLESLTSIEGDLSIEDNYSLTSLTGLDNLTSIGGSLSIGYNPALTHLTGLEGLSSIGGYLSFSHNNALTSLSGLDNIEANTISNLYIFNNGFLSTCAVQSICDYLASSIGAVEIYSNATGCNSIEQVDSACVYLSTDEINIQHAFSIYPNPASSTITISTPTTPQKNTFMTIYNINVQQILQRQITEQQTVVDLSGLPQGIYLVRIVNDMTVQVGKFIKE